MKLLPGVQPSQGCTEPVALALASALAARAAGAPPRSLTLRCDQHTLKNAQGAGIPRTGGRRGGALAAALGALAGDPERGLEVLAGVSPADLVAADALIAEGRVELEVAPRCGGLYVEARVQTAQGSARAVLEGAHTNLVRLEGPQATAARPSWADASEAECGSCGQERWEGLSFADLLHLAADLAARKAALLVEGARINAAACEWSEADPPPGSLAEEAEASAERGSRLRMEGGQATVVTSGYSGNQGLVATQPLWVLARRRGLSDAELAEGLALSHLVASYLRAATGVISPLCNAIHAAAAGAAAGCALLLGGEPAACEAAANAVLASAAGTFCDGAKPACSYKVGLGAGLALRAAQRSVAGAPAARPGGLARVDLSASAANLGRLAHSTLAPAERLLLELALEEAEGT